MSVTDARAYCAKTLDNINGQSWTWEGAEVEGLLLDILNMLGPEPTDSEGQR